MPTKTQTPTPTKTPTKKETAVPTKTAATKPTPAAQPHPLAGFIPEQYYLDDYVGREIDGIADLDVLAAAHRMKHNVLLSGPTGAAKTTFIYAYGVSRQMPVVNVACNGGVDVRQLLGGWNPNPEGGYSFVPGDLVLGAMHGAIILLNEVNFMPPKIAAVVYGLLDRRRTIYLPDAAGSEFPTVVKAHPDTFICADYNPGYQGTRPLNQAFKNRFGFKLEWGYNHDVEYQLANSEVLLELVEDLRKRADVGDLSTPISTNMMLEFEDFVYDEDLGFDFAVTNFVSAFDEDERNVVREVFTLNRDRLMSDMGLV